ncbi:MAG: aminomethyl-transferring glycine dehydrogenase subunit GcvPB [candidate division Zixibacteria bacterium]|nr:aminomethyl-transferring glycine dehydrogenase subunit GcvPB [candidate division Zixibacteria bacterium]
MSDFKVVYEKSRPGRTGFSLPVTKIGDSAVDNLIPEQFRRKEEPLLPEQSEPELVRHYIELSLRNHHIDRGFYPLGSCTMKYNPKVNDAAAGLPGFANLHPLTGSENCQGALELMYELADLLARITGFNRATVQPVAGAQCELMGLLLIRAAMKKRGNVRKKILIPDSAHGTNPASVILSGYQVAQFKSTENSMISADHIREVMDEDTAGIMITNPNTLGLFESEIEEIAKIVHDAGGLLYMDGANLNALLGQARPADMGFDIVHYNLHKTMSTPHGGGGPGAGALGITDELIPFLPTPVVEKRGDEYYLDYDRPDSIGRMHSFYGNFGIMVRAYTYIRHLGAVGLKRVSENAVLNANYLKERLKGTYELPNDRICQHEFVLSGNLQKKKGARTSDIAKRLLDYGIHAPTIYFPLIIPEAIMIEPTETESKDMLDYFVDTMLKIDEEISSDAEMVKGAPYTTPVRRLDEVKATKTLDVNYQD